MLSRLLRTYLARYRGALMAVLVLQLIAGIAGLFLPSLNADIIDNGVAVGDTAHIWSVSVWMLGFSLLQVITQIGAVRAGAHAAMGLGADVRSALFRRVMELLGENPTESSVDEIDQSFAIAPKTRSRATPPSGKM